MMWRTKVGTKAFMIDDRWMVTPCDQVPVWMVTDEQHEGKKVGFVVEVRELAELIGALKQVEPDGGMNGDLAETMFKHGWRSTEEVANASAEDLISIRDLVDLKQREGSK